MRLSKMLLNLGFLILLMTCNKEDDNPANHSVVGSWQLTSASSDNGMITTDTPIATFTTNYTFFGEDLNLVISFSEDPNTFSSTGIYTRVVTTTTNNQTITQQEPGDDFQASGTWERADNLVTITYPDLSTQTLNITSLSETKMSARFILNATEDIGNGATETNMATIFYTFERQ